MARAKSTARAEARRRYRASQASSENQLADEVEPNQLSTGQGTGTAATQPPRRGFLGLAMPDFRGDLRAFPHELRTNRWWWLSAALLLTSPIAFAYALSSGEDASGIASLWVRLMISPPAIPVLVAGFMSRRGPYLIGLLLGLLDGILILAFQTAGLEAGSPMAEDYFVVGSVSVLSATILGGGFAWLAFVYKGWLQNSTRRRNEQREKQAQEQKRKARDAARQAKTGR